MKDLHKLAKPIKLNGEPNDERIVSLNEFEKQCAMIEEHFSISAKSLTLYEFVSRLEAVKEKIKRENGTGK